MKVGFNTDINSLDADSGKLKFIIRLAEELKKRGIKINNKKPDVFLCLPKYNFSPKAKVNILRLDGITFNTLKKVYKNRVKNLYKSIKKSDALIYQGTFCKDAHIKFLGMENNKKFKIISNGASPDEFLPRNVKNYFLASAKWRSRKRLKYIVDAFLLALKMGLDSDLIVAGDFSDISINDKLNCKIKHPRIKYLTWQNRSQLKQLLSGAIASLHFNWLDCCPNSMVESIVAGCPVIYTKSGGQSELGKNSGIGIKDAKWDFKPYNSNVPPPIDEYEIALAMLKIKKGNKKIDKRKDLYISEICNQYISFFEELLQGGKNEN